jgi:hypothetical protein
MIAKPPTAKQTAARKRNWALMRCKGAFGFLSMFRLSSRGREELQRIRVEVESEIENQFRKEAGQ